MDTEESSQLSLEKTVEDEVEVPPDEISGKQTCEDKKVYNKPHQFAIPALPTNTVTKNANKNDGTEVVEETDEINEKDPEKICTVVKSIDADKINVLRENNISNGKPISSKESPLIKDTSKDKKCKFPYDVPSWGGIPPNNGRNYSLTILKEGIVKDTIDLQGKSNITFGRHPNACDVLVEHPSSSRYHAVLQYCTEEKDVRKVGYYLYDLGSTHGCYVNKEKVKPRVYVRVRVGYQIKFGLSTRIYIVEGPEEDQEEELDMEELRKKRAQRETEKAKKSSNRKGPTGDEDDEATWGFGEDAEEEELDLRDLMEKKKIVEVKDPKKTLKGFFEREGLDFEYETSERGRGNSVIHVAQVRLPIESSLGVDMIAEGTASSKKDAVLNCATDACKIIQAYDMMQNPSKEDERVKRQRELEANDFYDSDDDNYLDRTGSVERKRLKRKQWAGKQECQEVETHESLKEKLHEKHKLLSALEEKLLLSKGEMETEDDSLDAYMSNIQNKLDKKSEIQIKRQILELKKDIEKTEKLVEKSKPALPSFVVEKKKTITDEPFDNKDCSDSLEKTMNGMKKIDTDATEVTNPKQEIPIDSDEVSTCSQKKKKKKKKRVYGVALPPPKDVKKANDEANFVEWNPPEGQTGDGRTHLNDKFGY